MGNKLVISSITLICLLASTVYNLADEALGGTERKHHIPPSVLSDTDRDKIIKVIEECSVFKEIRGVRFETNSSIYKYLLDRLPLATDIIRGLNIRNLVITRNKDQSFHFKDGESITGDFRLIHKYPKTIVFYGNGQYNGNVIKKLMGKAVIIVEYREDRKGKFIENVLYIYLKANNRFVELIIKVFKPLARMVLDRKLLSYISTAREVCERITEDSAEVYKDIKDSKEVSKNDLEEYRRFFLHKRRN
ncbi:MAG: hypothetical protein HY739_10155 [Desulfobacterales bacterium]|nr:hypothetical protein [Desulfobacterales bacterium]